MKTILSIILLGFFAIQTMDAASGNKKENPAQEVAVNSTISGSIIDELSGEILTGVEVKLCGTDIKTYTDFEGQFSFNRIKPGDYSVEATIISYEPVTRKIKVNTGEIHALKIELEPVTTR
ncbi:carboxypeptidase-like regulatory domain-containing protein [Thermophagus sp. OGC60D27]|uniref:carboxypeptidase-like regulatory domain-containing protein n=1 Tax=Thermophagus sp. OGC60D27 TaxID=3458415 RepID=UPI004037650D